MRLIVPLLALATGFLAGLLVGGGESGRGNGDRRGTGLESPFRPDPSGNDGGGATNGKPGSAKELPEILEPIRSNPLSPGSQKRMAAFVMACSAHGAEAVPSLLSFLLAGEDLVTHQRPSWSYSDGELNVYPTVRAAYLEALGAIPSDAATEALGEVLGATGSIEESYFIARLLQQRGERDWAPIVLERALKTAAQPITLPTLQRIVRLAAETDPSGTARRMETDAPRGQDGRDPIALAAGLETMQLTAAQATVSRLLSDASITVRARSRFLTAFTKRGEVGALRTLREIVEGGTLPDELRTAAAYAAVNSPGFTQDRLQYDLARAQKDANAESEARGRFTNRLDEATRLVDAAFPGDGPRATVLRKRLEQLAKLIER